MGALAGDLGAGGGGGGGGAEAPAEAAHDAAAKAEGGGGAVEEPKVLTAEELKAKEAAKAARLVGDAKAEIAGEIAQLKARLVELGDPMGERRRRNGQIQGLETELKDFTKSMQKEINDLISEGRQAEPMEDLRAGEIERTSVKLRELKEQLELLG